MPLEILVIDWRERHAAAKEDDLQRLLVRLFSNE